MAEKVEELVNLRILFFAKAKDLIGSSNGSLVLKKQNSTNITGDQLMRIMIEKFPKYLFLKSH